MSISSNFHPVLFVFSCMLQVSYVSQPCRSGPLQEISYAPQQSTSLTSPKGQEPTGPRVGSALNLQTLQAIGSQFSCFRCFPPWCVRLVQRFVRASGGRGQCLPTGGQSLVLYLWWAGSCLEVAVGSGSPQATCLLMGEAVSLPSQLLDLRHPSTGVFRLVGGVRDLDPNGPKYWLFLKSCPRHSAKSFLWLVRT